MNEHPEEILRQKQLEELKMLQSIINKHGDILFRIQEVAREGLDR